MTALRFEIECARCVTIVMILFRILIQSWIAFSVGVACACQINRSKCTEYTDYKHEFNQQKGIARGSGMVERRKKMCQQSSVNIIAGYTDWHRLLQHNKISTDADAHNGTRRTSNHRTIQSCWREQNTLHVENGKRRQPWYSAKSITCRIIIIIFIIVHVSYFFVTAVVGACLSIYNCLHCSQSPCKSISGMQLQNRWYFNQFDRLYHTFFAWYFFFGLLYEFRKSIANDFQLMKTSSSQSSEVNEFYSFTATIKLYLLLIKSPETVHMNFPWFCVNDKLNVRKRASLFPVVLFHDNFVINIFDWNKWWHSVLVFRLTVYFSFDIFFFKLHILRSCWIPFIFNRILEWNRDAEKIDTITHEIITKTSVHSASQIRRFFVSHSCSMCCAYTFSIKFSRKFI